MQDIMTAIRKGLLILDGSMGANLMKKGLTGCPEAWCLEHPDEVINLQKGYVSVGSQAVYTCTMGANRIKLSEYGREHEVEQLNIALLQLTRKAVGDTVYVGGGMGPTGKMMAPLGELSFDEVSSAYAQQAEVLDKEGVDFFVVETLLDIQEARAALVGIQSVSAKPVFISMTFEKNGTTLTGTDPLNMLLTLQSQGAAAVGCNCSSGPMEMIPLLEKMVPYAAVPLLIKPNAGLPVLVDGQMTFPLLPEEFAAAMATLAEKGARLIGGCCGTTPEHISAMVKKVQKTAIQPLKEKIPPAITASRKVLFYEDLPWDAGVRLSIGTAGGIVCDELRNGQLDALVDWALAQEEAGVQILSVRADMPGVNEKAMMQEILFQLPAQVQMPFYFDTADKSVLEMILKYYPGRAIIRVSADKIEDFAALINQYNALIVAADLPLAGDPESAVNQAIALLKSKNIADQNIAIGLLDAAGVTHQSDAQWLATVWDYCKKLGYPTVALQGSS